ncbi:hypothetical protein KP509_23G084200 [Ceratopteris richardii]|nr:hypothetical protein KP509_23G084200 [Ceratopteris richardii]
MALQAEYRSALQAALLVAAKKYSAGPPQLLTQICLALSALVLRAVELKKPVEQIFGSLSETQVHGMYSHAILELLTVLPEEVIEENVVNVLVDSDRRWHFRQELLSHVDIVLDFLLHQAKVEIALKSEMHEKHRKVLRGLLSWVRVGCFLEIPQSSLPSHPLLGFVFDSLLVPILFDLAIEVLIELVNRHEVLPQTLLLRMEWFEEALLLPAIDLKNDHAVGGLACLFSEIGQSAPMLIAAGSREAFILTDAVLRCLTYSKHDLEIADSTLNFWCTIIEFILGLNNKGEKEEAVSAFIPVFTVLLDALFCKAMVSDYSAQELDGTGHLPDDLLGFRRNLEELLTNICCFLGPREFLMKVLNGPWTTLDSELSLAMVEVRLFTLNTVAVVLENEQHLDFSIILQLITAMRTTHIDVSSKLLHLVHKSAAEVVGSFSKLLCSSTTVVLPVLSFLASGMQIPIAASSSAIALRKLCEEVPFLADDESNLKGLLWIGQGLHDMGLTLNEEADVVSAIGTVLALISNEELLNVSLNQLLEPSYKAIEALLKLDIDDSMKQNPAVYSATLEAAVRAVTRLGLILRHLSVANKPYKSSESPILNVLCLFWPMLENLLASHHMKHSSLAAAVCRSLSFIIQASGQQFLPLLSEVMVALCRNFTSVQASEYFIRTATVCLEEFGDKEELGSIFIRTLNSFTEAEIILSMNSSYACDQDPDIVEAYMGFTSMFISCCPKNVIAAAASLVEISFKKATIWCTAMHRGAGLSALSYMMCLLEAGTSCLLAPIAATQELSVGDLCLRICVECGESAICGVIYALLGVSAMTRVHKAATVLQQLAAICHLSENTNWKLKLGWRALQAWLTNVVHALPSEYLRPGEAEQLIPSWLKAMESASSDYFHKIASSGDLKADCGRSLKRVVREFADSHRHTAPSFTFM